MERFKHLKKINELNMHVTEVTPQTVLDILFDMDAKIVDAKHDVGQSEIIFEYNNQTATLFFFTKNKHLQVLQGDISMKSLTKIKSSDILVKVLTDLLKRVF